MKNIFRKIVCLMLSLCCFAAVACKGDAPAASDSGTSDSSSVIDSSSEKNDVPETGDYLVQKGKSEYAILLPYQASPREIIAKDELLSLFREATGITLSVVYDNQITYDKNSKYISIGNTSVAKEKNLIPSYNEVYENGFVIKTVDKSIFLAGYTEFGTLYAAYEFLTYEFDYDYYMRDRYDLTKITSDVKLKAYDVTEVPDINTMQANYGYMINDEMTANRYRTMMRKDIFLYINDVGSVHNTVSILSPEAYKADHPDYFYNVTGQDSPTLTDDWCFTAHGDAEEFENMTDDVCKEITEEFIAGSQGTIMVIGQRDIGKVCNCSGCLAVDEQYNSLSAKGILFCNRVLEKVYAWFETAEGAPYKREFYLMLLAYEKFVEAPVTKTGDEYVPNNGLAIHDKFGALAAPVNYDFTIDRSENEQAYEVFYQWQAISNVFALYSYDTNFQCFFVPFNTFECKSNLYKTMKDVNCISIFDAGQGQDGANFLPSVWSTLKVYLECKLRWDTNIDLNYYTQKYFKGVYEDAWETMYDTYLSFRAHWNDLKIRRENGESIPQINAILGAMEAPALWPVSVLQGWYNNMELAREQIAHLKDTDKAEYDSICTMLSTERSSVIYLLVQLYGDYYSAEELLNLKLTFKADVKITNITVTGPASKKISSLLAGWGV